MDADDYMARLIEHLLDKATSGASLTSCLVEQVEAAAAALAAVGLLKRSSVDDFVTRAEDALEEAGLLTRLRYEQELTTGVGMSKSKGQNLVFEPPPDPAWVVQDIVPLLHPMGHERDRSIMVLSLTKWNLAFDVNYAELGPSRSSFERAEWAAWDDVGLRYSATRQGGGGDPARSLGTVTFMPKLNADASRLILRREGSETMETTLELAG